MIIGGLFMIILDSWSSRHYSIIDTSNVFLDEISYEPGGIYHFRGGISVYESKDEEDQIDEKGEQIAEVMVQFFDEETIYNDNVNMVFVADEVDADVVNAIATLTMPKHRSFFEVTDFDKRLLPLYTCYLERFYIYPQFRNKGYAKYLFKNFEEILTYLFNTYIHGFVVCPKPQEPTEKGFNNILDVDGKILERMIKILKKNGYKRLGKSEFYALNCASEAYCEAKKQH